MYNSPLALPSHVLLHVLLTFLNQKNQSYTVLNLYINFAVGLTHNCVIFEVVLVFLDVLGQRKYTL